MNRLDHVLRAGALCLLHVVEIGRCRAGHHVGGEDRLLLAGADAGDIDDRGTRDICAERELVLRVRTLPDQGWLICGAGDELDHGVGDDRQVAIVNIGIIGIQLLQLGVCCDLRLGRRTGSGKQQQA